MGWINFDDVVDQLVDHGFKKPKGGWESGVDCGKQGGVRTKVDGCSQLGWFKLHTITLDDGRLALVGSFGWWKGGDSHVHKIKLTVDGKSPMMSPEQRAAIKARIEADRKAEEAAEKARKAKAARHATLAWSKCSTEGESAYLDRKGVGAFDVRYSPAGNLVIPMRDIKGGIHGLQVVYSVKKNGRDKDFWPAGLAKKGHFHLIGGAPDSILFVAEGYATAASVHQAIKQPVAVAFDAGNLMPVAQALHKHYPRARIVICADDDYRTEGNPGVKHAEAAALAVGGTVVIPQFADERPTDSKGPTDFNDLHILEGWQVVAAQIEAHLAGNSIAIRQPAARGESGVQGGGEKRQRRAAQSIMDLSDIVERFVPLDDGTGDYVFDTWTNKVAKKSQMLALLPAGVRGDDIKRHPVWMSRGAYYLDEVGFDPTGKDKTVKLNTWRGFQVAPKQGECGLIKDLAQYLCSAEKNSGEVFDYLFDWFAYQAQNPGVKLGSAIIMHGGQGTGKSTLFDVWMAIFEGYSKTLNQRALEDKFNSDWVDCTLAVKCEEIAASSDVWHVKGEVKDLITGDWIRSNEKNSVARPIRNRMNFAILSNETIPMPLERDDRRFLVVRTPPPLSTSFYAELREQIQNGGVEAFFYELLNRPLQNFHPKSMPPMTESKRRLIMASAPSELVFIEEWLSGNVEIGGKRLPVCPCTGSQLHTAYARWSRAALVARPRDLNQFVSFIHGLHGWDAGKSCATYEDLNSSIKKNRKMVIPSDDAINKAVMAGASVIEQEAKTRQRWLTEGFFAFEEVINAPQ